MKHRHELEETEAWNLSDFMENRTQAVRDAKCLLPQKKWGNVFPDYYCVEKIKMDLLMWKSYPWNIQKYLVLSYFLCNTFTLTPPQPTPPPTSDCLIHFPQLLNYWYFHYQDQTEAQNQDMASASVCLPQNKGVSALLYNTPAVTYTWHRMDRNGASAASCLFCMSNK